jgi:hypothetical protein
MENKILFEAKGMRDASSGGLAMVGIAFGITLLIVSFATKGMIGAWYYYAGVIAICVWIVFDAGKKHAVDVQLKEGKGNGIFLSVNGKVNNIEIPVEEYSSWYVVKNRSPKHGGKEVRLHFKAKGNSEEELLCFTKLILPGQEPRGWMKHDVEFPLSQKCFMVDHLPELVKALDDHEKRTSGSLQNFKSLLEE